MNRKLINAAWVLAIGFALVLYMANLFLGEVNQDEGWYLYASRLVSEGQLPYVDFAFTQGPITPYVYSMVWPLVDKWGIAAGRSFTIALGLMGAVCASLLAYRLARSSDRDRGRVAVLIAMAMIGVNVYQSYFTTVVKTYALAALLLTSGCLALSYISRKRAWPAVLAGVLIALATATRSSIGIVLPLIFVVLLYRAIRIKDGESRLAWLWFAGGAGVTGLLVFLPYIIKAPDAFMFFLFEYHTGRTSAGGLTTLIHKAGFISRLVRAYFVACGVGVTVFLVRWLGAVDEGASTKRGNLEPMLWAIVGIVTLVHIAAPFPYDDYQVVVYPLFAVLIAVAATRVCTARVLPVLALAVVLLSGASAFSSARNQEWFVAGRDRIWWPLREQTALGKVQSVGRTLRELSDPGDELLTQDAYLAVEAGLRLPAGLEMGPFSYFPDMSRDDATARHLLNRGMLKELLVTSRSPLAVLSGWSFAISLPTVTRVPELERNALLDGVQKRYETVADLGAVGQADTYLTILKLRGR